MMHNTTMLDRGWHNVTAPRLWWLKEKSQFGLRFLWLGASNSHTQWEQNVNVEGQSSYVLKKKGKILYGFKPVLSKLVILEEAQLNKINKINKINIAHMQSKGSMKKMYLNFLQPFD